MQGNPKNGTKYSIAALMLVTATFAGYLGGREHGFEKGKQQWQTMPETIRSYYVGDITLASVPTSINVRKLAPTINELADSINEKVIPHNWKQGNPNMVSVDPPNRSLVVAGNSLVHAEVSNFIAYLRSEQDSKEWGIGDLLD